MPQDTRAKDFPARLRDSVFDLWFGTDKLAERQVSDALETTSTAIQTLQIIPIEDSTVYHVHTVIVGVSGADRATYELIGTFYRSGGNAAQEGSTTSLHAVESDASWNVVFDTNENDVRIRVSGVALWRCHSTVTPLTN